MSETKNFIATWPELGISVECAPYEDGRNRWIYDWYLNRMPIKYLQLHAMVTGTVMYTWATMKEDLPRKGNNELVRTNIIKAKVGSGGFAYNVPNGLAGGRTALINFHYGDEKYEDMTSYYCFHVVDGDIPKLQEVGKQVAQSIYKTKKPITCVLTVKES